MVRQGERLALLLSVVFGDPEASDAALRRIEGQMKRSEALSMPASGVGVVRLREVAVG